MREEAFTLYGKRQSVRSGMTSSSPSTSFSGQGSGFLGLFFFFFSFAVAPGSVRQAARELLAFHGVYLQRREKTCQAKPR